MATTEAGHEPNRVYTDQDGNIHLNGSSLYLNESGDALSASESLFLDGVTAGTVTASKALVVDANKDIASIRDVTMRTLTMSTGADFLPDDGTATASSDAATVSKMAGVVTTESKSSAAGATYTITITNTLVAATSMVFANVAINSGGAGTPVVTSVAPGSGSFTVTVQNIHSANAFDGAHKISFLVAN